jgi:outer membrane protein OmpA-like peptidoglycan-associated protein
VQQLDGNQGNPELEAKAKALLADETAADQLDDERLRQRLEAMRKVMESNELSRETERALRQKLRADRGVLRDRLAKAKAEEEAKAAAEAAKKAEEQGKTDGQTEAQGQAAGTPLITSETPRRRVLADRRRSEDLDDNELRIRIKVFLDFENDPSYADFDEEQRTYWRETVRRDRERLRRRMEEERNIRRIELDDEPNIERIEIDDENYSDGDEYYDDVFAAEVGEDDIEKVLVAPPKRKVRRVASVEEIEQEPGLRDSLRRIEIDTIRFGFNEAFVREEEIGALDEIALVMEKVLRKYPREVFLIEGHTDAVGSDAYNLKLSRARAEAVKKALTAFYVIPARNLQTVGLGERYLKIPTAEAEAENRRVSISRATAILGEAEEE